MQRSPDGPQPSTPPPGGRRVLRRSRRDRMVGGVCGGLARYIGVDSALLRILFVTLVLFGGSGIVAYLLAWLVIPDERAGDPVGRAAGSPGTSVPVLLGGLLVAGGVLLLLEQIVPGVRPLLGPILLIGLGFAVLWGVRR